MIHASDNLFRICVIGPESTGKSVLSESLARHLNTVWVPEYAREYIGSLDRPYHQDDLLQIARGQITLEEEIIPKATGTVIMDTNLLVIQVWSQHRYGSVADEIKRLHDQRRYDHYLLTDIDLPWTEDPQREHPHLREHFRSLYQSLIKSTGVPFSLITGTGEQRTQSAIEAIHSFINRA